ncbi:GTP cyclohydrolase I [Streptomyces sp. NPDC001568]|uniref:GTP cyclohydrolase I n=1 Tax=Streptomyces sp. NPDC001568 TaxID=3364588 RepID=UPI0036A0348D
MTNTTFTPVDSNSPAVPPQPGSSDRVDVERVAALTRELLVALGEDPDREGLAETPLRVASWWKSFLSPDPGATATCFPEPTLSGQLVVVGDMSVWTLCEHHMLPMSLQVAAGYLPDGDVVGLSKFGRIAQRLAARLQVQERFTQHFAEELAGVTGSKDVAVAVRGTHLCMSMRGVRMEQARTTTVDSGGRFLTDPVLAAQFMASASAQWGVK